jgi:hypothetical protein
MARQSALTRNAAASDVDNSRECGTQIYLVLVPHANPDIDLLFIAWDFARISPEQMLIRLSAAHKVLQRDSPPLIPTPGITLRTRSE